MSEENSNDELIKQLKELIKKLDNPKKNMSAWLGLAISFLSTVVIAGLSLYFSNLESERSNEYNLRQIEVQKANLHVEELKALNSLIPALTSKDSAVKKVAIQMLEASKTASQQNAKTNKRDIALSPSPSLNIDSGTPVIAEFYRLVKVAESPNQPIEVRKIALEKIGQATLSSKLPNAAKDKAIKIVTTIASSASEPESIKKTAKSILKNIKNISLSQLESNIKDEIITRPIDGIIIHNTGTQLSIPKYNGLPLIMSIANVQVTQFNWNKVSWHYLIAPDGSIWLGVPLNDYTNHCLGHNKTTISIMLFMDGDIELPSEAQLATLKKSVDLLTDKLKFGKEVVYTHRYFTDKNCPGKMVTEQFILEHI